MQVTLRMSELLSALAVYPADVVLLSEWLLQRVRR
jgi:hypothetical protein